MVQRVSDGSQVFFYEGISSRAFTVVSDRPGMMHSNTLSSHQFIVAVNLRTLSLSITFELPNVNTVGLVPLRQFAHCTIRHSVRKIKHEHFICLIPCQLLLVTIHTPIPIYIHLELPYLP